MPLNRYQIRNEYSLADPELFKVADKDDPEALLEGVAMAGLVGVLRQLGDLAEFAAEIFHDLHEEVMATSARGHGLIVRTQQLEAEFPLIERALLSQTSHTAFLYNSGVEWHPNLRMDQSVVTRGDLPRFVMESYEECRGPPRLFLLDKFDVAGAGACLKRFTDPSFFKMESTSSTGRKLEGQREKKTRRVKKRGPRWRNGDTPESFPSSHAKLHQLFLEERIECGINDPARRVKLKKRQFTGSLFEQDNVRSYMEKFLDTSPQEQKVLHEICIDPLPLTWKSDNPCESGLEIVEYGTIGLVKESIQTDNSLCSSPDVNEMLVKPSMDDIYQDKNLTNYGESLEMPGLNHGNLDGSLPTIPIVLSGEEIAYRESKSEESVDVDSDVASEIDNFEDALANIESEVEMDSESKKNASHLNLKPTVADSDGSERQRELRSFSLGSHSVGNSVISEDGDNFLKEKESSSCSNSLTMLSKTTTARDSAAVVDTTTQASNAGSDNMYFGHYSTEEIIRKEREKHAAAYLVHAEVDDILKSEQIFGEATNTSSLADLNKVTCSDVETSLQKSPVAVPDPESEDSVKCDAILGELNQEYTNQTAILHSHRTFSDTSEDNGLTFSAEPPISEKEDPDSKLYSDNDLAHLLETNSFNSASLVEGHDKNLGMADVDACSDSGSSLRRELSSDPSHPYKTNSVDVACEEDFGIPSTQARSKDLFCVSDFSASLGIQELLPRTTIGCTSSLDFAAKNISCSLQDTNMEDMSDSALQVCQAGNLPGSSNQLQTCAHEFSSFDNIETAKIIEGGSSEADISVIPSFRDESGSDISRSVDEKLVNDSLTVVKASSILDSLKTQHEWLKIPSEDTDTILDIHQDEACEQISGNDIGTEDAKLDTLVVDPVSQSRTVLGEANLNHASADSHGNQKNIFSQDASPPNMLSEHANNPEFVMTAENDSALDLDMEKLDHIETVNDPGQVNIKDDDNYQNAITLLASLSHPDKLTEPSVLVSEDFYQNEENLTEELTVELTERRQNDPVQDTSVTTTANFYNMSSDETPSTSLDDILSEDVKKNGKLAAEVSLASVNSSENPDSASSQGKNSGERALRTSSLVFHGNCMLDGDNQVPLKENSGKPCLSQQGFPGLGERSAEPRINLEPPSLPPLPPMQWRLGKFENSIAPAAERQMMQPTFVPVQVQPTSLPTMHQTLAPVPPMAPLAMHHALSSFQPVSLQPGNSTLCAIPPTTLPTTLPAMHYTFAPLQPVTLPTGDDGTEIIAQTFTSEGQLRYSDGYVTQQGVFTLPMPVGVSEGFFQINTSSVGRQDNRILTVPLTSSNLNGYATQQGIFPVSMRAMVSEGSSLTKTSEVGRQENVSIVASSASTSSSNGTLFSEETYYPHMNQPESGQLVEGHLSEHTSVVEAKVDTGTAIQNELLGHSLEMPDEEAGNLYVQLTMDQPPLGLVAPDAGRTWSSVYDGVPTHADGNTNGTIQKKPPRPRNPLIDEVVAIDKSKLRKVERSKPQLQPKPEEGESMLEKMQLRKVERVKPPADSKVEGEKLLEQYQLRKVGNRVKPPVEQKSEERDFLVEQLQLRKVGEKVKPPVELKSEETEFLLQPMQLRKVKAKAKEEVEPKVEETESPLAQLRKVRERVKEEVQLKVENSDSPRVQLRKVIERADSLGTQKAEERDSLFEQIKNKSFNLKPAVAARPNIQGPRTNLKVAAILEKASTVRQAMAGSDEDDDADSWSDDS